MLFRLDTGGEALQELNHHEICTGAFFRLDKKIQCTLHDIFLLEEGQLYIMIQNEPVRLQGRWIETR